LNQLNTDTLALAGVYLMLNQLLMVRQSNHFGSPP